MEVPSSEDEGVLTEWAPYTNLINQIPLKVQPGLFAQDLSLTCIDASKEYLALGTNFGLVYWYGRQKGDLQKLRCEVANSPITFVKIVSTVDFMVAAGNKNGQVTVFQIPKAHPDSIPESLKPKVPQQVERYTIGDLHQCDITFIEWSKNGMKLFSGDKNGLVVMTEIDFYMHLCKSSEIINESYEIVQISYYQNYLLVSSVYRSIICHKLDSKWDVNQVGKRDRKSLIKLGGVFHFNYEKPNDVSIYSARPGLRVWTSDKQGEVLQTLLFKDAIANPTGHVELLNPAQNKKPKPSKEINFGPLYMFKDKYLVSYNDDQLYIVNPNSLVAIATVDNLRRLLSVSVNREEIFVLEGDRSIVRISFTPDCQISEENLMTKSLTNPIQIAVSTIKDLTHSEAQINFSDMTEQCDYLFNALKESTITTFSDSTSITKAEECFELPPVKELPAEIDTTILTKIVHSFIGDREGVLDTANNNGNSLEDEDIIKLNTDRDKPRIIGEKSNVPEPINDQEYSDEILFSRKITRKNNTINMSGEHPQSSHTIRNEPEIKETSQTADTSQNDLKTTKPSLMTMSFCTDECSLIDDRSPNVIENEIKEKEELLAKILGLEPITTRKIKPQIHETFYSTNEISYSPILYTKTLVSRKDNPNTSIKNSTPAASTNKIEQIVNTGRSKPLPILETPPKCVSIPSVWNLEEIKIDSVRPTAWDNNQKDSVKSNETIDEDWEIV